MENLRLSDIEARLVRQVQREEDEINLASSQFARGVKVRSVAVKTVAVEASLRGLQAWLRTAGARVDRGVHVEIEKVRLTNGAPLVMGPVQAAGQHAFVSGLDDASWLRLTTAPDWTLQRIPEPLAGHAEACGEYLSRRGRPSGFWPMLAAVLDLNLLPVELLPRLLEAVRARDAKVLMELTDPQVVNIGLIADGLERYQKLVEQAAEALQGAEVSTEAASLFEVLTLDVPFPDLQAALLPFVLEAARGRVPDARQLVHEVRIGLNNGQGTVTALGTALLPLVVRARLERDPLTYGKSVRLAARDADVLAAQAPLRKVYLELAAGFAKEPQPLDPEGQLAQPLKQLLFAGVVQLTLNAQYTHTFRNNQVPATTQAARDLLAVIVFRRFNIAQLKSLHPSMPAKGVARSLAEKTPVTNEELRAILEALQKP
ncbi:MAG TPA: hypothetical protein VL359_11280, partial [bacterium]|nr:hypothetical protein [bacterium]